MPRCGRDRVSCDSGEYDYTSVTFSFYRRRIAKQTGAQVDNNLYKSFRK